MGLTLKNDSDPKPLHANILVYSLQTAASLVFMADPLSQTFE